MQWTYGLCGNLLPEPNGTSEPWLRCTIANLDDTIYDMIVWCACIPAFFGTKLYWLQWGEINWAVDFALGVT